MGDIGDLYVIMVLKVTLNDRIDHFGTYIRNQETKLYQASVEKKNLVDFG